MQINNILIPYDGSEHSNSAFNYALDLAKKYHSNLIAVVCIVEQNQPDEMIIREEENLQLKKQKDVASQLLSILASKAEDLGINFKGIILKTSSVTDAILSYAESNSVDIIILGSRGLGGFKKLLLGSVASVLSQYSKCPVLVVK
jgi:nucleotide-binding universal stress UspA family protein